MKIEIEINVTPFDIDENIKDKLEELGCCIIRKYLHDSAYKGSWKMTREMRLWLKEI